MRLINLVDRLDRVNFGIWNAAIATAEALRERHGVESEIWYPAATGEAKAEELKGVWPRALERLDGRGLAEAAAAAGLDRREDLVVSHGCWQYPTRWGARLGRAGFRWLAVPHGMLEPWSLRQKRWQKRVYWWLMEGRLLRRADGIRAVGQPEAEHLRGIFGQRVEWIPNGVPSRGDGGEEMKKPAGLTVLFMARLHHKKGVLPLVEGWARSVLGRDVTARLVIAGPDDGERGRLEACLREHGAVENVELAGPIYGEAKERLLRECHAYVLPSFSEGFPTSVLEAMQAGLVPLISRGCNFPEVFAEGLGIEVEPVADSVRAGLDRLAGMAVAEREAMARKGQDFIESGYSYPMLAERQVGQAERLLGR